MLLEIKNLSKKYGDVVALDNVSMRFLGESLMVLLGPSGCGKTTLLRTLVGFERPDSGNILINGSSIVGRSPKDRGIGIVFQDYALFPHMNVEKNISYGLKFDKASPSHERANRPHFLMELLGIEKLKSRLPEELSAGQQQRVAIARSLVPNPQILLLDEPFSALDEQLRVQLRFELKQLLKEIGIAAIHITHDQEEALAIADQIAVMREGMIEQIGSPREIYENPATPFIAEFVGRGNLLRAKYISSNEQFLILELVDGQRIRVQNSGNKSLENRTELRLLIRPERLALGRHGENEVIARFRGMEFLGDSVLILAKIADQDCFIRESNLDGRVEDLRLDEEITLSFRSQDAKLIAST